MHPPPPRWADKLLEHFCSDRYFEEIQGDLHEWFDRRVKRQGVLKARLFYFLDVIRFVKSYRLKTEQELFQNSNNNAMLKNYFLLATRTLWKQRAFSLLNLFGLTIGFTAFMLIFLYVTNEKSYDQFHENKEQVYRLQQDRYNNGELTTQWAAGAAAAGPVLSENLPEITDYVTMHNRMSVLTYGDKYFKEEHGYFTTQNFFKFFSIPLLKGNPETVLTEPQTVAISASTARKYFGDEDPIGKTLYRDGRADFTVTGIFEDLPTNTHMQADVLYSFSTYISWGEENIETNFFWDGFYTYIMVEDGVDPDILEAKVNNYIENRLAEFFNTMNISMSFKLQPLADIHLTSNYMREFKINGNAQATYFLLIVAIFIIVIAWINYINLATAKSLERAKEVGVRKALGSQKGDIMRQFMMESLVLNLVAFAVALLFVIILLPMFNALSGRTLSLLTFDTGVWFYMAGAILLGSFLSGIYPAMILSNYKPTEVLKGKFAKSGKGALLRKVLVIFQFTISLILLIGTVTVFTQLNFLRQQDLGVAIDQTLVIEGPGLRDSTYTNVVSTFKEEISKLSSVKNITISSDIPGSSVSWNAGGIRLISEPESASKQYRAIAMDDDFIRAYGLEILYGRNFDDNRTNEGSKALLTETAARQLGFPTLSDALTKEINFWGDTLEIIGIVKDYHHEYLKKKYDALIFRNFIPERSVLSIKIAGGSIPATLETIEEEYMAYFPGNPFNFYFLDDHYNQQYKADMQFMRIFGVFAVLAIIIACLGLFGLTSYMTTQKTKEIGIRKVLGASVGKILGLLSKEFAVTLLIAALLAAPIGYLIIAAWLEDFAFKIEVGPLLFIVPLILIAIIAMATVAYQTIKAATSNPVKSLRDQ